MLHGSLPTNGLLRAVLALVMGRAANEIGSFLGRLEGVLLHEVNIGFGAGGLVGGVVNELDSLEGGCHVDGSSGGSRSSGLVSSQGFEKRLGSPENHVDSDGG